MDTDGKDENGKSAQSPALRTMMDALNWAYDQAASAIPLLGSPQDLAKSHMSSCKGKREEAIDDLIKWQAGYAGAAGFVSNIGGLFMLPVSVPANLASVLFIQLRMIAAIAHLRGYKTSDEKVRTLAFLCLIGSAGTTLLQEAGVSIGAKVAAKVVNQVPGIVLKRINQAVGFRLVTKAGSTGIVNLVKVIPFIGGAISGGIDAGVTLGIGAAAKQMFLLVEDGEMEPQA